MKKLLNKISELFLWLVAILFAIILFFCLVFRLPYDYIKYKISPYYKKEHRKYEMFVAGSIDFKIYNEIIKNDLPIQYVENSEDGLLENGWFIFNDILIIPNAFWFRYDDESENWNYCVEEYGDVTTVMPFDDYIKIEIEEINKITGKNLYESAVVLTDVKGVDEVDIAKSDSRFLVYDGNLAEVLKDFINSEKAIYNIKIPIILKSKYNIFIVLS